MVDIAGKHIFLGVTASISAYKSAIIASKLSQMGCLVDVVMSKNAQKLIGTATFEALTRRPCFTEVFADHIDGDTGHIAVASRADLALIVPCSANSLAKLAHGIADDMLSTALLPLRCPLIVSPAMNTHMYANPAVQANLAILRSRGIEIIEPRTGMLACGVVGKGRVAEPEEIIEIVVAHFRDRELLKGKRVLVSAGATREPIDAVRYLSNPSTGKMGYACARSAQRMGAEVTLVTAPSHLERPAGMRIIEVTTAAEMAEAIDAVFDEIDITIMTAAVSDFRPKVMHLQKIHKSDAELELELEATQDILAALGKRRKAGQFLCGFCMETENLIDRANAKLRAKGVDMIVANDLSEEGSGFGGDTNIVSIVTDDAVERLPMMSKTALGYEIVKRIARLA